MEEDRTGEGSVKEQERLPNERPSITHRFRIGKLKCYLTVGLYPDGRPGELFLVANKQGSLTRGLMHCLAVMVSLALQHGVPLAEVVDKLKLVKFDPAGLTGNKDIPMADSVADYIGKWLEKRFLDCSESSERRNRERETDSL